ncbi:MAG TPA: hypothetical protein VGM79_22955 [Streptosporangiaceae bacterium]
MGDPVDPGDDLTARLRRALTAALRARDMTAAAALRSALGAIGNAEAVPVPPAPGPSGAAQSGAAQSGTAQSGTDPSGADPSAASAARARPAGRGSPHVAGAVAGLGAAEAERRRLSPPQVAAIVQAEIDERLAAAAEYERAGRADRAARLAAEARALAAAAGPQP